METTAMPAPDAQATIGPFGRIIGVFFSPKNTFEDIVRKPSWVAPVLLWTALSLIGSFVINQRTNWREYISQQIERNSSTANLPAEQKQQRIEMGAKLSPTITLVIGLVFPVCIVLLEALILWGAYNLLGGANTRFGISLGITSHANLVGVVGALLLILVLYLKPPGTVDLDNPIATNVAVFLPDGSAKWLESFCKSLDILSFWTMALLAIGFGATNPRKLKGGKAFSIVFSVWGAYVVIKVLGAFITG
jgi:hypothetical protein